MDPGRLLIVEDDADVGRLLRLLLAKDGYTIDVADSAARAEALAAAHPPDVSIVERGLRDGGGLELIDRIKAVAPSSVFLVMTIDPTVEVYLQAMERGAFDLLVKPFANLKLIAHKVRRALTTARAIRARDELKTRLAENNEAIGRLEVQLGQAVERLSELDPERLSGVDGVTGIASEHAITERLRIESSRAKRYNRPLSIAVARIDGLDAIFERFGNAAAEEAFRGVAALGHAAIRELDLMGRHGPTEFLFVFPETAKPDGLRAINRVRELVSATPVLAGEGGGRELAVTMSAGLAAMPNDSMGAEDLLVFAERALKRARGTGMNRVLGHGE